MSIPYETPLHFALVWSVTRDQELLLKLMEQSDADIEETLQRFGRAGIVSQICSNDQLKVLAAALADKGFGLRGTPFEKTPHIDAVGLADSQLGMERDIDRVPLPRRIKLETVNNLTIAVTKSEFRLRPHDWLLN